MKPILAIFIFFLSISVIQSQNEWQEHLSHDRTAYAHHGHFIDLFGGLKLKMGNHTAPMNTTENIKGNRKNSIIFGLETLNPAADMNKYSYQTLRLGENINQVTLKAPQYDNILGHGVHSIIQTDLQSLSLRKIDNTEIEPLNIIDVAFQNSLFADTYFITDDNKLYRLSFGYIIETIEEFEGSLKFHNGLNNITYKVHDGVISNIETSNEGSVLLGEYDRIDNNPFNNELIEFEQNTVNRYSFSDFTLTRSDIINGLPIDHLFVEDGFYYLIESDSNYSIYFFSDDNSQSELYYELPKKDEIINFEISEFNIRQDEILFLGLWKSPLINENISYVQKRNINAEYAPVRKDLELSNLSISAIPSEQSDQFTYSYSCTITNLSDESTNYFTLYSDRLDLFENEADQFIKKDFTLELKPGESIDIYGTFDYFAVNSMSFHIAGVDFGIDSDMSNNSDSVNLDLVSNEDIVFEAYIISPNPSSDYISIGGDLRNIESVFIIDLQGNKHEIPGLNTNRINTSALPAGQYWLQINTPTNTEIQPFVKN